MKKLPKWAGVLLGIGLLGSLGWVDAAQLEGIRALGQVGHTRVVLEFEKVPASWNILYRESDNRLTLSLPETINANQSPVNYLGAERGVLKGVSVQSVGQRLNVSLTANQKVKYHVFSLANPARLVIDLFTTYEQRTMTKLNSHMNFTRWERPGEVGRLQLSVVTIDKTVPMEKILKAVPYTVENVAATSSKEAFVGVATEKFDDRVTEVLTTAGEVAPMGRLRYVAQRGYSIQTLEPNLWARINQKEYPISGVNQLRRANDLILYTSYYGDTTHTNNYGQELILKNSHVIAVTKGNSPLAFDELVLSGHGKNETLLSKVKKGDLVEIVKKPQIATISISGETVYTGGKVILAKGEYIGPKKDMPRAPRTLLGVTPDGGAIILSAEGYSGSSVGITAEEGASYLKEFGAVDGMEVTKTGYTDILVKSKPVKEDERKGSYKEVLAF